MKKFLVLSSLFLLCTSPARSEQSTEALEISGYYKTLNTASKSLSTKEDISASLNRLRLEFKKQIDPWQFYLTLDNEAVFSDFANLADFDQVRNKTQDQLASWDLDKASVDNDHLYLKHSVYRAYVKYYTPEFQAVAGKQSIDWGRMRFYSPLDVFNPVGPLDLEPDERMGVDAVNLNFSPEAFAGMNVVVSPPRDDEETSAGLKIYKTISTYDAAIIAATVRQDQIYGVLFDGYLKSAGFRGEITHNILDNGRAFARVALGLDYTFNDKLYGLVEQFYNGGSDDNSFDAMTSSYRTAREIMSLRKDITSVLLKYSLTPLVDLNQYVIYDWDGSSVALNPEIGYDITKNIECKLGTQIYFGNGGTEFGDYENLYYSELKVYF